MKKTSFITYSNKEGKDESIYSIITRDHSNDFLITNTKKEAINKAKELRKLYGKKYNFKVYTYKENRDLFTKLIMRRALIRGSIVGCLLYPWTISRKKSIQPNS